MATKKIPHRLRDHGQLKEIDQEEKYFRLKPFGNCTFFSQLAEARHINIGNVGTFDNGDVKVNYY